MSSAGTLPSSSAGSRTPYRSAARKERGRFVIRLWLPLTLLWIILAPFALVAAPALALAPGTRRLSPIRAALGAGRLLLALSGTLIEVDSPAAVIRIHIV